MSMSLLTNRAILVVLSSNFLGKTFIIDKDETMIGRLKDSDISLDDPAISKNHCKIIFDKDNKFYIEDSGSKNSTFLNGKELKKRTHIIYGDRIIIGNTILRFFLEEKIEV
jgi:pSer/pThr/pTyr-binding forkhead associated (FHA) protein